MDIGLHPDAGRPEPPDCAPNRFWFRATVTVEADVYAHKLVFPALQAELVQALMAPDDEGTFADQTFEIEVNQYYVEVNE